MWDWNGTLLNDTDVIVKCEQAHFPIYGVTPPDEATRKKLFCFPIQKYYERLGFDFQKHDFSEVNKHFMTVYEEFLEHAELFTGTTDLLHAVKTAGRKNYILSAAPQAHLSEVVEQIGVRHFFEGVYGLPHLNADTKINRGRELIREHAIDPSVTLMIGDTDHDYEVGHALGFSVLLVADGHKCFDELRKLDCQVLKTRF